MGTSEYELSPPEHCTHSFIDNIHQQDEVDIVVGVLKIASKTAQDCMVPWSGVFCLSTADALDERLLATIMASGFSRIPVFEGADPSFVRGFLLTKRLIVIDPAAHRPVASLALRRPLMVAPDCPLIDLLNAFQEGRSHLALVAKEPHAALDWCFQLASRTCVLGSLAGSLARLLACLLACVLAWLLKTTDSTLSAFATNEHDDTATDPIPSHHLRHHTHAHHSMTRGLPLRGGAAPLGIVTLEDLIEEIIQVLCGASVQLGGIV